MKGFDESRDPGLARARAGVWQVGRDSPAYPCTATSHLWGNCASAQVLRTCRYRTLSSQNLYLNPLQHFYEFRIIIILFALPIKPNWQGHQTSSSEIAMASRTPSLFTSVLRRQLYRPSPRRLPSAAAPSTAILGAPVAPFRPAINSSIQGARLAHSIPKPRRVQPKPNSETDAASAGGSDAAQQQPKSEGQRPKIESSAYYQLSFTCVPCGHRSHHNVSKQGYHTGSTLITCPECRNRHVISDHLGIFGDKKITVEDILREKGQLVKRGSLGEDGDIEFWPDDQAASESSTEGTGKS